MTKSIVYVAAVVLMASLIVDQVVSQFDYDYPSFNNNPPPYPQNFYPQRQPQRPVQRPPQRPPQFQTTTQTATRSTRMPASREFWICVENCPSTSHYNPVCGSDNQSYKSMEKFSCARQCGRPNIRVLYMGTCGVAEFGQTIGK